MAKVAESDVPLFNISAAISCKEKTDESKTLILDNQTCPVPLATHVPLANATRDELLQPSGVYPVVVVVVIVDELVLVLDVEVE